MITPLTLMVGLLLIACFCLTVSVIYLLRTRTLKQKKHKRNTDFDKNKIAGYGNTQAAGNVINNHYGSQQHIEDLQAIIEDQRGIIQDFRGSIDRLYLEKEDLQFKLDGIFNEYITLKYERTGIQLLDIKVA